MGLIEGPCHVGELRVVPWLEDELVIVCAPGNALLRTANEGRVPLRALRQAQWLLRESGSGTREAVEHALLPHLHQIHAGMQLGSTEAIKQAVAEGLGLACLSLCAVRSARHGHSGPAGRGEQHVAAAGAPLLPDPSSAETVLAQPPAFRSALRAAVTGAIPGLR